MPESPTPDPVLARLEAHVSAVAGLRPPRWVLAARLRDRAAALGLEPAAYVERVVAGGDELARMVEALRVGETRLFRHRAHVSALIATVLPALCGQPGMAHASGRRTVRAWSAGCASGEEAYTLAIVLARQLPAGFRFRVLGSDISDSALAVAERAIYPAEALDHVPEEWRAVGFERVDGARFRVRPEIADRVRFERRNLADGEFPAGFDLIWCRNVLIYFTPEARDQAVVRLTASLVDGGYLFVGYAETLRGVAGLEPVRTPDAVVYRRVADSAAPAAVWRAASGPRSASSATPAAAPAAPPAPAASAPPAPPVASAAARSDVRDSDTIGDGARSAVREPDSSGDAVDVVVTGDHATGDRMARELAAALSSRRPVTVHLDGAAYLGDGAAAVLRRWLAAARQAGVPVALAARRPGTRRWLRRHGLAGDEHARDRGSRGQGAES